MACAFRSALIGRLGFLCFVCVLAQGTANSGMITFSLRTEVPTQLEQPLRDATGSDLAGAEVFYEVQTALGSNTYDALDGLWSQTGTLKGGFANSDLTITLSGDSHSNAFQLTNTGLTYLLNVTLSSRYNPPFSYAQNTAFNVSTLGPGSTSDSSTGSATYFYYGLSGTAPYYGDIGINFDGFGLAPGATATFFAPADIIAPEPPTGFLLLGLAAISFPVYRRYQVVSRALVQTGDEFGKMKRWQGL